jgi:hypothetical protein
VPIPGLGITIPEGVGISALVILNVPNPFAQGNDFPGGTFGISVSGTISPVVAVFTYNEKVPPSTGRIPTTLVASIPPHDQEAGSPGNVVRRARQQGHHRHAGYAERDHRLGHDEFRSNHHRAPGLQRWRRVGRHAALGDT